MVIGGGSWCLAWRQVGRYSFTGPALAAVPTPAASGYRLLAADQLRHRHQGSLQI
jgi:hypothetical protein